MSSPTSPTIIWLAELDANMTPLVGGKGSNLGELLKAGFSVPNGFAVTTTAFNQTMESNDISTALGEMKTISDPSDLAKLEIQAQETQSLIHTAQIPPAILSPLRAAFISLDAPLVAVRSSATMEDSATASFAGQHGTYLNIQSEIEFTTALINCWASLYEPRTVLYRFEKGLQELPIEMGVVIQEMIDPDVSGVIFTLDPITGNPGTLTIEAIYGLGEPLVSGEITPDLYIIEKASGKIHQQIISEQPWMLKANGNRHLPEDPNSVQLPVAQFLQNQPKVTEGQLSQLTQTAISIDNYYGIPQDIEWAICDNVLYILQTRPITTAP